jgi:hypothetical protein
MSSQEQVSKYVPSMLQDTPSSSRSCGERPILCPSSRRVNDLLPSLDAVYVGLSAGSMVLTPRIGEEFVYRTPPTGGDETLGVVDFSIFPYLGPEELTENTTPPQRRGLPAGREAAAESACDYEKPGCEFSSCCAAPSTGGIQLSRRFTQASVSGLSSKGASSRLPIRISISASPGSAGSRSRDPQRGQKPRPS